MSVHAYNEATRIQAEQDGVALTMGYSHAVGIRDDGTLIIFGGTANGQRKDFPERVRFKSISAGRHHTCGVRQDGTLLCFGNEQYDQRKDFPEGVRFRSISAGGDHACGVREDGTLLCFGDEQSPQKRDFPEGVRFKSISAGFVSTCGVKEDGTLLCFGRDADDQRKDFPEGVRFRSISSGYCHTCGVRSDGTLRCFGNEKYDQRMGFPEGVQFKSISAGSNHACGIREDGTLLCFGRDADDQRKDFPEDVRFRSIVAGGNRACGVTEKGTVRCFGSDEYGERNEMPTEEFFSYPSLKFDSFESGLLKLTKYVYPEKKGFVTSVAITSGLVPAPEDHGAFSSAGYKTASARLLAFNYLEPFLTDIETETIESKVLPVYRSELSKWNGIANVEELSDIFFSDQSYSVSQEYLIAALQACGPLESDSEKSAELTALITSLGEIKASGLVRVADIIWLLDEHSNLVSQLTESSATKGFAGVIHKVRGYLSANVRESK